MVEDDSKTGDGFGPLTGALFRYWDACRGDRVMPARRDLNPVDIPMLLPNILLLDVEEQTGRLRFRLVGTRIVENYGSDYTGQYLDETWFGRLREQIIASYEVVRQTGQLHHGHVKFTNRDALEFDMERLILPLSSDGETIDKLIALLDIRLLSDR